MEQNGSEFDWSAEISGHFRGCLHILKDKDPAADGSQDHMRYVVDQERRPGAGDGSIGASAITFPSHVPRHVQSSLARLHQNLGHPSLGDLSRHLKYARRRSFNPEGGKVDEMPGVRQEQADTCTTPCGFANIP